MTRLQIKEIADEFIRRRQRRRVLLAPFKETGGPVPGSVEAVELAQLNADDSLAGWELAKVVILYWDTDSRSDLEQEALIERFRLLDTV